MQVIILDNENDLGDYAARHILDGVHAGRIAVLGVATGSSPTPIYRALVKRAHPELSRLTAFALDEYVGLSYDHPESYHAVIHREVTEPLGLDPAKVHVPDGNAGDPPEACLRYEAAITASGGIDLQILGIGTDGHIGFNEPSSSLRSRTRIKTLTQQTRLDNARYFSSLDQVPVHCITQGLGTILDSREVLLIAQGANKATAVAAAVEGPLTSMCPGSVLQMHPEVTVLLDRDAASELRHTDYYRYVLEHLPTWQK